MPSARTRVVATASAVPMMPAFATETGVPMTVLSVSDISTCIYSVWCFWFFLNDSEVPLTRAWKYQSCFVTFLTLLSSSSVLFYSVIRYVSSDCVGICQFGTAHVDTPLGDLDASGGRQQIAVPIQKLRA